MVQNMNFIVSFLITLLVSLPHSYFAMRKLEGNLSLSLSLSEGTDELFADDTNLDPQGDGDAGQIEQEKFVEVATHHLEGDQVVEERNKGTLAA